MWYNKVINKWKKEFKLKQEDMTEFDKAKAVIVDKNNSFAKLREVAGGSISRLNVYRHNPEKLRTARWIVVHNLASLYHE